MEKELLKAKVEEVSKALEGLKENEICVVVDALMSTNDKFLPGVIGAIWHIGAGLNAAKAEIKPTKKGIGLDFIAKRGQSLFVPGKSMGYIYLFTH